jgi:hypothetical protein
MTIERELSRPAPPSVDRDDAWDRRWRATHDFVARRSVVLACLVTAALHLMFLTTVLGSDEGGFAMMAKNWTRPGSYLYGPVWVDRPPLLIAVFWVANQLGPYGTRILATACAVVLVLACAAAARIAGGRRAERWAAWTACGLGSSVLFVTQALNGEPIAAPIVAIGIAALLASVRRHGAWSVLAGLAAMSAVLVKQNFVDVFVFAGVLLVLSGRELGLRRTTWRCGGFVAGAAVPAVAALLWARAHAGVGALAYAMFGFRMDASKVMASWSFAAPRQRLWDLGVLALASGLFTLLAVVAVTHRRQLRRLDPVSCALVVTILVEVAGILVGGNYWSHYLIALIPTISLAAGIAAVRGRPQWSWMRAAVGLALVASLVADPVLAIKSSAGGSADAATSRWLRDSARTGDTLMVPFTHANVIDMSGLRPAYPYNWSLPIRTLDPHLDLMVRTLNGPAAPTWVLRWDNPHAWGFDPGNRVDHALTAHYREVATLCGHAVWLRKGEPRDLARVPSGEDCHASR